MSPGRLSSEKKKAELKSKIRPGSIVYLYCDFIRKPKTKYVVILFVDFENNDSLVFIVNSDVRPLLLKDPHLSRGQIELNKDAGYSFLDHNSYLDCTEVLYGLDPDFLLEHLAEFPDDYKGELRKEEVSRLVSFVKTSQTIPLIDIKTIVKSLETQQAGG